MLHITYYISNSGLQCAYSVSFSYWLDEIKSHSKPWCIGERCLFILFNPSGIPGLTPTVRSPDWVVPVEGNISLPVGSY